MRKLFLAGIFLIGYSLQMFAQDSLQSTIVIIGDAGQLTNGHHPVVKAARKLVPMNEKTTVVFVGDNLYKTGLPDNSIPTYDIAKAPLDSQIFIAKGTKAHVYFVPGNHDWANGGSNGYRSILRVQSYIDLLGDDHIQMFPRDGCPGPVEISINNDITLVLMDSQWWMQETEKPGIESDCPFKTQSEVLVQLEDIITRNSKKLVLMAFHHPLKSYGPHGGYFTLKQHIFPFTDIAKNFYLPLPVIGSAYPLTRAVFGTTEDLKHPLYQQWIQGIEKTIKGHPNIIFMAGHEHTLQMIQDSGYNMIVSGSGSKHSRVSKGKHSLFASSENGFVTLEISKNKNVRVSFYTVAGDSTHEAFTKDVLNFSTIPEEKPDTIRMADYAFKDSAVISASEKYKHFTGFKDAFLGSNYRREWSMPVQFKVFDIRKEQGGFTIKSLGGGKQTKSLKLEDKNGKEWTLRSIEKDPEKALPENLRGTIAQSILQDMISASNPYSPLVVPVLAKAEGIPSSPPKFFFVPDDPAFGIYRKVFANTVCALEDRDPVPGKETKSTNKVLNKLLEDNKNHVDQPAVLRARLLDMLIADFDRHADQWKWGTRDTGKGKLYYPVPRDRDQAFFNSNGLLLKFVAGFNMKYLQGFKKNIPNINELNFVAKDFDRTFLNSIDKKTWRSITDDFISRMTDDVIKEAATKYPPEIKTLDSAFTVQKLMSRRKELSKKSMQYYKFLSRHVTITGSNETEYFHVQNDSGKLKVSVYKRNEKTDSVTVMYRRIFDPKETRELVLYGLNGDDKFEIDENVASRIRLRVIGGKGKDSFDFKGNIKTFVYDLSTEKNVLLHHRRTKTEWSSSPSVLDYSALGYRYSRVRYPHLNIGFNAEDGILFGFGFLAHKYAFRKEPYASFQKFTVLTAPTKTAYQLKYQGIFNKVILKKDILVNAEVVNPTLNNFFGFGNETKLDKSKDIIFYRARTNYFQADLLIRARPIKGDIFKVAIGPTYYRCWNHLSDNEGKILNHPAAVGIDSTSLYSIKDYVGGRLKFDIDYVNNELFPSRGITFYSDFSVLKGTNQYSRDLVKLTSDLVIYATISDESKVTTVLKVGAGHIFTKNPEYFQMLNLGSNNFLRGYRKNRFTGTSALYASIEPRFKIFKSKSYILPGDVGLLCFYDIGKVWMPDEKSLKFHGGYGAGLYFVPYNLLMISATMGFSNEDRLFNFTVGTKFNLSF